MKTRIILADTDPNYLFPLQLKFVYEYGDNIDLEVITERSFFHKLFAAPQTVDLLIVSEDLYEPILSRHNINHIFVTTECKEQTDLRASNVLTLFKYTSPEEIFSVVYESCREILSSPRHQSRGTQTILVTSASGGVGKTTVALGICMQLTAAHKKILYIDSTSLQLSQSLFSRTAQASNAQLYCSIKSCKNCDPDSVLSLIRHDSFDYLPPFRSALISYGLDSGIYCELIGLCQRSSDYDTIVVDTDTVFNEAKVRLMDCVDKVILVTTPSEDSVLSSNLLISSINSPSSEKYLAVCNHTAVLPADRVDSALAKLRLGITVHTGFLPDLATLSVQGSLKIPGIQDLVFLLV